MSQVSSDLTNTPCATLAADYTFVVPVTFSTAIIPSASGAYGYVRDSEPTTCAGWIVDVSMGTTSSTNPYKGTPTSPGIVIANGDSYDLPASAKLDGDLPTTEEDCTRLTTLVLAYTWPHTDTGYTYVGGVYSVGTWADKACTVTPSETYGTIPKPADSTASWDRYRYVVSTIERTTYQEVALVLSQPPPF